MEKGGDPSKIGSEYSSQKTVYDNLGKGVLTNAWDGYNTCLFAYGQTGSSACETSAARTFIR